MATLTLKNVPDGLIDQIRRRALRHRRSLNREAILILERGAGTASPVSVEARLERIRALRDRYSLPPLTEKLFSSGEERGSGLIAAGRSAPT